MPVLVLLGILFILLQAHFHEEAAAQAKLGLQAAKIIYRERVAGLEQSVPQFANRSEVKGAFNLRDEDRLRQLLREFDESQEHASILIAVDDHQRLIARRGDGIEEVLHLGDMLTPAISGAGVVSSTRLISKDFLSRENAEMATLVQDVGLVQFVVVPVWFNEQIEGALIAGILLTSDTWLGDSVFSRLGMDFALFGGKPAERVTLHATSSQPRKFWAMGELLPGEVAEAILLDHAFYGALDRKGGEVIVAFEPLKDHLNRTIGAIGISTAAKGLSMMVFATLGKGLVVSAMLGLLISLVVTHFVRNDINRPLTELIRGMRCFGQGELDMQVNIQTGDQFEQLGEGFNAMAQGVFKREERLMKHNAVAKLLMSTLDLGELLEQTLKIVVEVSSSQIGIIYLWDQSQELLVCQTSYGARHDLRPLKMGEGYPGRAAQGQMIIIEPFVGDMVEANIESGFSQGTPTEVAYIPLVYKERLLGVLVLGSLGQYQEDAVQLIGYLADQISIALDNAIMHHRIQELSITDGLTGLYNRRYINDRLTELWAHAVRHNEPLTVVLADIDNFKSVNDTYGHDRGDEVICRVADIYRSSTRQENLVARYGGEEFLVVLANTDTQEALVLSERIGKMAREQEYDWIERKVTLSIGVATYPKNSASSYVELVRFADQAMYKSKLSGKDRVSVYDPSIESVIK